MLLTIFIFSIKVVSKLSYYSLLTIVLRTSINMNNNFCNPLGIELDDKPMGC